MTWTDLLVLLLVAVPALICVAALAATVRMVTWMPLLREVVPVDPTSIEVRLSVIVPARDEADSIGRSLESLLGQDYPHLEIVAVDDRSTDGTAELVDEWAAADARVTAVHIERLPEGWLGKTHAMAQGIRRARGDWMLIADADVEFASDTLSKAVTYSERHRLDFLTAFPEIGSAGLLGDILLNSLGAFAGLLFRPWKLRDPDSTVSVGAGAFLLVRRSAYDRTPGIEWLRLEVTDDAGMALLIKEHGGRCDIVNALGQLRIVWYRSYRELLAGLQKNCYATIGRFSLVRLLSVALFFAWLALFPLLALIGGTGALAVAAVGIASLVSAALVSSRWTGRPLFPSLLVPPGLLLVAFMMVRAGLISVRAGGLEWRGRFYPTSLLEPHQRVKL